VTVRPIADADWPALCAYDAAAFGAERGAVLAGLRGRLPAADLVAARADEIAGFLLGRDGGLAAQIGPLIADDDAIAGPLVAPARWWRARSTGSKVRCSSTSPTASASCAASSMRAASPRRGRSRACFTARPRASTTRRAPSRWSGRNSGKGRLHTPFS